ncbi:MOSC and FAD-binding oxidoreductase domain-containing protein [Catellatospora tritici]|uniref:MOSC and FAD-binding oxidoreductase domain-containing protein n=1 Tax=Catellatospora tritici TaxID=2851566 RepID=UPI001C2CDC6D|nr:MOSC and FAD-binding oxidoreductase domain-containing protein [Catellatospora tritici]MBV1849116.1 MOSC domain-containing protein [Catellatospora tritici]
MATLLSVNVGLPKDVAWRGRTVHTGVWKQPVDGPVLLRRLNLDGDGQGDLAGHGGEQRAVLVYQLDSYRHWQRELGRDDLTPGNFGENFTVDGLPDDEVCIGDRYRVGEAVVEVTQPRVTCYRVGLRMNEPRLAALLVAHRRPGFYLRVLTEGLVRAGDEIVKLATGPEALTVAEIDALLYLPGHPRDGAERALRVPALSPGWQASMRELLAQPDGQQGNPGLAATGAPPAWPGFRPLTVTAVDAETRDVLSLRLAAADGAPLPGALPGQFLTLRLPAPDGLLIRSYSLSGSPGDPSYRISVKVEPHGAAGAYLRANVRPGTTVEVAAPRGTFTLDPGDGPVLLLSAGIGATPVLAMLHALAEQESTREVWWVHCARDSSEHAFAAESRALLERLPRAHVHICYSRPGPDDVAGRDFTTSGRLTAAVLRELRLPAETAAYLCGPAAFTQQATAELGELGLAALHSELFGAGPGITPGIAATPGRPPHPPEGEPGTGPAVAFARSGLTVPWSPAYGSLLEFAEACDVPVRWSCRTGVCHTCESGLLSGQVAYDPEPVDAPADGNVLICSACPLAEVTLDL